MCLRTYKVKSRFSGAVTERSYASAVFIPKEAHHCEWQCMRQLLVSRLAAAAEGQTVAGLSRCRGHGSGFRSMGFCEAGAHSVPDRGLMR